MAVETARDHTQDWILPPDRRPRSFAELEARIDDAIGVARSAEAAALAIGDAAIEAAEQARRAAEMAEAAAIRAAGPPNGSALYDGFPQPAPTVAPAAPAPTAEQRFNPPTPLPPGDEDDGDHDFAPPRPSAAATPSPAFGSAAIPSPALVPVSDPAPEALPAAEALPAPQALPAATAAPDLDERLRVFAERASRVSMRLIALGNPAATAPSTPTPLAAAQQS